jgi:protein-S-isoprenylcysteine O-methyltransferase Ste14
MNRDDLIRALALYLPIAIAGIARLIHGRRPRQFAACLLSFLWTLPALLLLQLANVHFGWWTFGQNWPTRFLPKDLYPGWEVIHSMPLELLLGWAILWSLVPQLAFPNLGIPRSAAIMLAADIVFMPLCAPTIHLNHSWLIGETVALAVVLLPALLIARWTECNLHLRARAAFQITIATMLFLFLIPELGFYLLPHFLVASIFPTPHVPLQLVVQLIFLLALPGLSAVFEFADRGLGTPIPYDPPQRLVTSGIYRYLANPMQLSATLVMFTWALFLRNILLILPALIAIIYSAGIAEWDEREDLDRRFGTPWRDYRAAVRNWFPRWRPYHAGPSALLYIARTCGPCSEVRAWIEARHPIGLVILDAESLPADSIRRMRYDPADGTPTVEGIRAMGRALEHINLAYTFAGSAMRLPVLWRFLQLCLDAAGLGPRNIPACPTTARPQ